MERRRRALIILFLFLVESALLPAQCQVLRTNHPPPFNFSSGIVRLIIKSYTDELIRDLGDSPALRLSESQAEFVRQRLGRLYEHVRRHPALHQRYLWVGRDRPQASPDEPLAGYEPPSTVSKRGDSGSRQQRSSPPRMPQGGERGSVRGVKRTPPETPITPLSEEICRTSTAWERLNETVDSFGNAVEVVQDEAFPQYDSECTERSGFMILYHRKSGSANDSLPSWGAVEVPHHCTCKITPKVITES
ncbi:uncharacterized protein LOC119464520 isoform X2 [Dermacentor silvarum]|uniref:uncharacterized protein LOC119464520 isoform X2 n=1 Tax=Dermacentor silvarum TaxID=543639 RepID=UPI002100F1E1|nr:uncharacterized protein LOC119464520 isoform X2 [Dermacentor silvarum]